MKDYGLILLVCMASCTSQEKITRTEKAIRFPAFNKEGHRGIRGMLPENTIPSMYLAIDHGAHTIEVDVVISKDRQVVVSHDVYFHPGISLTPEGKTMTEAEAKKRLLFEMNYDSIRKYDVGMKPHRDFPQQAKIPAYKPLLSELVDSVEAYLQRTARTVLYNIELKTNAEYDNVSQPPVEETVDLVMEVVKAKNLEARSYLQSFDFRCMRIIHKKYPQMATAILIGGKEARSLDQQLKDLGYVPEIYSPHYSLVTPALISACRAKGMKLIPWTVNEKDEMRRLKEMGVDGIITDYVNLLSDIE